MTTDLWRERASLRISLLKEIYDFHFLNSGFPKSIVVEMKDNEKKLALMYLEGKGFIELLHLDNPAFMEAKITSYGIDEVESQMQ